jgi:hypothetical protein
MGVAITFCAQTEQESRHNERYYSLFGGSEAESLPHLIEFGTPALFQLSPSSNHE